MEIIREQYLNELKELIDKPLVKVITGVRKCGKSTLLKQFIQYLQNKKRVNKNNIIFWEFDNDFTNLPKNSEDLNKLIKKTIKTEQKYYCFFDEIQLVNKWENSINSLSKLSNVDIYITGSNAYLFSSKLSTLIRGKRAEVKMFPLSFKEYADFYSKQNTNSSLTSYLKFGGMPGILIFDNNEIQIKQYLQMIFNDIVINDILNRNSVKDSIEFKNIVKYIGESIGNDISIRNIANYLKSNNTSATSVPTVSNYINWLCESLMIYLCNFSNIHGKELLKNLAKYYIVDLGIRNALLGSYGTNRGSALENVIYIELLRRRYDVKVGRIKKQQTVNGKKVWIEHEVDFVANKLGKTIYIQVTESISSSNYKREIQNFQQIKDNHEKIILSLDDINEDTPDGIKQINIIDWLLDKRGIDK